VSDASRGSDIAFHRAIRKYGPESFTHEILERMTTEAGAKRAEQLWIRELGTRAPNGYNLTDGGEGCVGYRHSAQTRALMSDLHAKRDPASYAPGLAAASTAAAKAKVSARKKGKLPACAPLAWAAWRSGRKHTPESIAKMRAVSAQRKRVRGRFAS